MKMMYNGTQIKSLKVKHYEMDSNFATVEPSDMQAGKTAVARGKKITGTGKSFEFANYGAIKTNTSRYIPSDINVIELASSEYPIKLTLELDAMKNTDFSNKKVAIVNIDGIDYDLTVNAGSNLLNIVCDRTFTLQLFYGKDNYA